MPRHRRIVRYCVSNNAYYPMYPYYYPSYYYYYPPPAVVAYPTVCWTPVSVVAAGAAAAHPGAALVVHVDCPHGREEASTRGETEDEHPGDGEAGEPPTDPASSSKAPSKKGKEKEASRPGSNEGSKAGSPSGSKSGSPSGSKAGSK